MSCCRADFTFTLPLTVLPQRWPRELCETTPLHEAALSVFDARCSVKFFFSKELIKIGEIAINAELQAI